MVVTFGITYETDSLLQNMTDRLPRLTHIGYFQIVTPIDRAQKRTPIFQNQGSFPHALCLKRRP